MENGRIDRPAVVRGTPLAELQTPALIASAMKAGQGAKIAELRLALVQAGIHSIDQQAQALGLRRSTAWAVLRANHKASGLSAKIVKRMLASHQLPPAARETLRDYVEKKLAGSFGHNSSSVKNFRKQIGGP
jgi:hypothetical protein